MGTIGRREADGGDAVGSTRDGRAPHFQATAGWSRPTIASRVVDYLSDALQLTARTNGALVPTGTLVAWNERQAGHLPFAASSVPVVLQPSHNLHDWQAVVTLPVGTQSHILTDSGVTGQSARFFRVSGLTGP